MTLECKSFVPGKQICRDGFPQRAACFGSRCHACGGWFADKTPPACMDDDFAPPHMIDDAGMPRLAEHRLSTPTPETRHD